MISLYIDTSSNFLYSGIVKDDCLVGQIKQSFKKDMSTFALSEITKMIRKSGFKPNDVDKIIVCNGPGSFTGSRIAVTIAKTMAYSLNIPIKQIDALTIKAVNIKSNEDYYVSIKDRNGAYIGKYDNKHNLVEELNYISNSEYALLIEQNMYEDVNIDYEAVYNYLSTVDYINVHNIKPLYVKGISALNDK